MKPQPSLASLLVHPDREGALIPAHPTATQDLLRAYSHLPPARMSWCRGFLGNEPLRLDDTERGEGFVRIFRREFSAWLGRAQKPMPGGDPAKPPLALAIQQFRHQRIVELESRFVSSCVTALERWNQEPQATVMWDLDETLIGSGTRIRFLRPSSEAVLNYTFRHLPLLRHGILTSLSSEWVPAAATIIGTVLNLPRPFGHEAWRFSFRPALDLFEKFDWETVRNTLKEVGIPDCPPGRFDRGWPFYVTEFSRVITLRCLQRRGVNIKVIDNDLNACFDPENPMENQVGDEARSWLGQMLGDTCATGPHWWPQETEEWILELIRAGSS
jgi:hypothetical protein